MGSRLSAIVSKFGTEFDRASDCVLLCIVEWCEAESSSEPIIVDKLSMLTLCVDRAGVDTESVDCGVCPEVAGCLIETRISRCSDVNDFEYAEMSMNLAGPLLRVWAGDVKDSLSGLLGDFGGSDITTNHTYDRQEGRRQQ